MAFNPKTPLPDLEYLPAAPGLRPHPDHEPELPFVPQVLGNLQAAAAFAREHHPALGIVADGGIDASNIAQAVDAGANVVVAGRGVFGGGRIVENVRLMRDAAAI